MHSNSLRFAEASSQVTAITFKEFNLHIPPAFHSSGNICEAWISFVAKLAKLNLKYTNADLKIFLYVPIHIKIISWKLVLTKTRNDLKRPTTSKKRPETTWNNLQWARNDLERPTTSKKRPETTWNDLQRVRNDLKRPTTTYNEQETTWNDLQRARNYLKWPTASKRRPEMTYNEQETTWNDLQRARNALKRPTTSKKRPEIIHKDTT